ncbi:DHA2 family efflux MFS transporter permease subunit [Methylobacterium pseudosasicola]|uniref:MFS transporter, DHA2 family, multidrug resistance protein n=1 Tax=Methylobacterium pseudosasicola TaxID=582667 RepID=A0A1I4QPX4_9HYPH|nr:DHA2 family efflux MFS transporter permease subunit [Methylobacterium pseudosasicola]SFM41753.1 MFS transporter, DHA2 family, multidrug resistance protein [Methylobacterium pseudosasicola]
MSDASNGRESAHNPWLVAIAVTLAAFMEVLDTTIVNVALPYIAGSLAASNDEATYTLTAYLVANGIVLTIAGWLSDTIGRKRYFLICIGMFTVSSFLCGISQSLGQIIVFRLMQGFFGGGLQPSQQAIILDTFPPAKRGAAFGVTAVATVVAPVLGPTLGGYLVEHSTWRWIFFINVPVGIFTFFVNVYLVQDPPDEKKKRARGLDYVGLSLIVIGIGCMQVMIDRGEVNGWFSSSFIRIMAVIAFLGIFGAICWLLIADEPVVDLNVFKDRNFSVGCLLIGAVGALLYGGSVLTPNFAQQVLGYTALDSGFILSPGGIAVIFLIPVVAVAMKFVQTRYIIMFGFAFTGAAMFYSSFLAPDVDFRTLVWMRTLQTAPLAFLFVPISTIAYLTLPDRYRSEGSALFSMFRNVFGSVGISLSTAAVTERTQADQAHLSSFMTPLRHGYNLLIQESEHTLRSLGRAASLVHQQAVAHTYQTFTKQAQVLAYGNVYQYAAVLAFLVVPLCLLISAKTAQGEGGGGH